VLHLHVYKYVPDVHALLEGADEILENGSAALGVPGPEFETGKAYDEVAVLVAGQGLQGTLEKLAGGGAVAGGQEEVGIIEPNLRDLAEFFDHGFEEIVRFLERD
jgi:hypothetical protein